MYLSCFSMVLGLLSLSTAAPAVNKRSFSTGPLMESNFPDATIIHVKDTWHAFATASGGKHVPHATSKDFKKWTRTNDEALPKCGAWSTCKDVWAPDVMRLPSGKFVLYYSARSKDASNRHCIAGAVSDNVSGPFKPTDKPIACHFSAGGAIDPAGFIDSDGTIFVTYKEDGNSIGSGGNCGNGDGKKDTWIWLQRMEQDGVTPKLGGKRILNRGKFDGPLIEAPSLSRIADKSSKGGWLYFLFFSSNCYAGSQYDVSYAYSTNGIHGPYTKSSKPLLLTGDNGGKLYSPGGMDTAIDLGSDKRVVFHSSVNKSASKRQVWGGTLKVNVSKRTISI